MGKEDSRWSERNFITQAETGLVKFSSGDTGIHFTNDLLVLGKPTAEYLSQRYNLTLCYAPGF